MSDRVKILLEQGIRPVVDITYTAGGARHVLYDGPMALIVRKEEDAGLEREEGFGCLVGVLFSETPSMWFRAIALIIHSIQISLKDGSGI